MSLRDHQKLHITAAAKTRQQAEEDLHSIIQKYEQQVLLMESRNEKEPGKPIFKESAHVQTSQFKKSIGTAISSKAGVVREEPLSGNSKKTPTHPPLNTLGRRNRNFMEFSTQPPPQITSKPALVIPNDPKPKLK